MGSPAPPRLELWKPTIPEYELIRPIGQGAYGDVWLARGITGVYRAVKVVWRHRFQDTEPFDREFRGLTEFAAISLSESRQMALLHVGRNEAEGFFYYVMELADDARAGPEIDPAAYVPLTLRELRERQKRLPVSECIELGVELLEGLAFLHRRNLVHRDIKPSNVILVGGRPKLADIGLVSSADAAGTFVGTEGFIAPEGPGTPASDVFSVGRVLYELATGLDRKRFPSLPTGLEEAPDARAFFRFNELLLRACTPDLNQRYVDASEMLVDLRALQSHGRVRRRWRGSGRPWLRVAVAVGLLALGTDVFLRWHRRNSAALGGLFVAEPAQQSIAVLPFSILGPDTEDKKNAYFAAGLHEDVITNLAKIRRLRVIPRTSVMAYGGEARDLRQIARELEAAHILEGSVRREGNKIRLTVRLIAGEVEQPIWADDYDRDLTDVFAIQRELAERIATSLQTTLTTDERRQIGRPTAKPEAYDLYLQARGRDESLGNSGTLDEYKPVVALYEQALAKDPGFALAHTQLALLHLKLYWFPRLDATPERLELARAAAEAAQRLAPDDPATKLAFGKLAYNGYADFSRALEEYRAAERGMPNDDQLIFAIGITLRRLGRWDEALNQMNRAAALNPRWLSVTLAVAETLPMLRRFREGEEAARKSLARFPNNRKLAELLIRNRYELDGDRAAFLSARDALPLAPAGPARLVEQFQAALERKDYVAAELALSAPGLPKEFTDEYGGPNIPLAHERARIAWLRGDMAAAHQFAVQALPYYQNRQWLPRQQAWVAVRRAELHAYAGEQSAALSDATAASAGAGRDAIDAVVLPLFIGRVHIILGRQTEALETLRQIATGPCIWGPQRIRHDAFWSRLANDARFDGTLRAMKRL